MSEQGGRIDHCVVSGLPVLLADRIRPAGRLLSPHHRRAARHLSWACVMASRFVVPVAPHPVGGPDRGAIRPAHSATKRKRTKCLI